MQVKAGAVRITCQKLGEAEVMADAGLTDIFLPYNILGQEKLDRLHALHRRITISVTVDNKTSLAGLAQHFMNEKRPLKVLVECDTGMGRCGVQTPGQARELAHIIEKSAGLCFVGLMTYPATGRGMRQNAGSEKPATCSQPMALPARPFPVAVHRICGAFRLKPS